MMLDEENGTILIPPRPGLRMRVIHEFVLAAFLLSIAFTLNALSVHAQEAEQLKNIEEQLQQSQNKKTELAGRTEELQKEDAALRLKLIESVRAVQDNQLKLIQLDLHLASVEAGLGEKEQDLSKKKKEAGVLIRALLRLAAAPDIALLLQEQDRNHIAAASKLMTGATRNLEVQAKKLQAQFQEITELKKEAEQEKQDILKEKASLEANQRKLDLLLEENAKARQLTHEEERAIAERLTKLADEAQNLRELIEGSRNIGSLPSPSFVRPLPDGGQGYLWPAKGEIVTKLGEVSTYFGESNGIVIAVGSGAAVIAPFDGQVVFAGPFRSFGQLLILEHKGGYHTVMAGLARIDAATGQWLLAGEPLGVMRDAGSEMPKLYLELHQGDHIIDPAKWLH